ncbi:MAG: phage recombination protein Bet [Gemmiger sp.]
MAQYANSITKKTAKSADQTCTFTANGAEVKLTPATVKNYLVSGNADRVTDQEIVMFINLCKYNGLNPWLREVYCIKYGNSPATMVVGKETFQKRADADPNYDGQQAGVIVLGADGSVKQREGCLVLPEEQLVGGWAKVYRKDRAYPSTAEVSLDEYLGRKSDGSPNGQWTSKPATMIRKVALVQALREAFPARLGAMYAAEERGVPEPVEAAYSEVPEDMGVLPPAAPAMAAGAEDDFFAGTEG